MFAILTDKVKIAKEIKHTKREKQDRERAQSKGKKKLGPFGFVQRPKKWARIDSPPRVEALVASNAITHCVDYGRRHLGECWRK